VTEVPPVLSDDHERWVFEEMQTRARGPWHVLVARREEFVQEMVEHLAMVDRMLTGRSWILGAPSVADFGIFGGLSPLLTTGGRIPDSMPDLQGWTQRIQALGDGRGAPAQLPDVTAPNAPR